MNLEQIKEMQTTIKELKEFAVVSTKLADKIAHIYSKTVEWHNICENAQLLAKAEKETLEQVKADMMIALNRLPHELAPLKNRIAEQERQASALMTEAMAAKKEAKEQLARANALLEQAGGMPEPGSPPIALNRLPHELAPLKNRIAEQERQASTLMTEAVAAKKEAKEQLTRANALLEQASGKPESVAIPAALAPESAATPTEMARGPGRPRKEKVA